MFIESFFVTMNNCWWTQVLYIFSIQKGFPDSIQRQKLSWHGWGHKTCFLFVDDNVPETLRWEKGTEQENNFPVLKGKKVHLVIAILVSQKQHCNLMSLPRELLQRHSKPIFSDLLSGPRESLYGSGNQGHNTLQNL